MFLYLRSVGYQRSHTLFTARTHISTLRLSLSEEISYFGLPRILMREFFISLFQVKFTLANSHSIPIPVPTLSASYSRVCAIRRSSTSVGSSEVRQRRLSRKPKASPFSLDENSLTSMSSISSSYRSHTKPFYRYRYFPSPPIILNPSQHSKSKPEFNT